MIANILRGIAVAEIAICMFGFAGPIVANAAPGAWRVWLLLAALELFMFSCGLAVVAHFGSPSVAWYRTPVVIVGGTIGMVYLLIYGRDVRRGQHMSKSLGGKL